MTPSNDLKNTSLLELNGVALLRECVQPSQDWLLRQEELRHICKQSIEIGCLQLARAGLLLLLEKLSSFDDKEAECEAASSIHNDLLGKYEQSMSQIWSRDVNSYSPDEYLMLIQALLIYSQSNLAFTLNSIRPCRDKDISFVIDVECGRASSEFKSDLGNDYYHFPLSELLRDETYPIPNESSCQSKFDQYLPNAATHQAFFSAHIIPKRLMIPFHSASTEGYDYEHPAFDIPSLLWDKNLPEAVQWLAAMRDIIDNIALIKQNFDQFCSSWSSWPDASECPHEVLCRVGLPNVLDLLWTDQMKFNQDFRVITDFCPASIAEQVITGVLTDQKNTEADTDGKSKLLQLATDISYLMSFTKKKYVVDLSVDILLHTQTVLCLPSPVKFIVVDFDPNQLKNIVQASYCALYPQPLPFVFEDSVLMDICCCWHALNSLIKEHVPTDRLVQINMQAIHSLVPAEADFFQGEISKGIPMKMQKKRLTDLLHLLSS